MIKYLEQKSDQELKEIRKFFGLKKKELDTSDLNQVADVLYTKEYFKDVVAVLNQTEKVYLELMAASQESILKDQVNSKIILPTLVKFGYIEDSNGEIFDIPVKLINLYNEVALDHKYETIQEPTEQALNEADKLLKELIKEKYEQDVLESKINALITNYSNQSLGFHLASLTVTDLKAICKFYSISGYSNKNKTEIITLITSQFFKDFTMLEKMLKFADYDLLLNIENAIQFNYDNFTYQKGATREIFLFAYDFNEILFIPSDVLEHIQKYEKNHVLNADIEKIKFYRGMLNLYGFVKLDFMEETYKRLMKQTITVDEIKKDIQQFFPNLFRNIKGNWIKHEIYSHQQMDLDVMFSAMDYYTPVNKKQVFKYVQNAYVDESQLTEKMFVALRENMKGKLIYDHQVRALFNEIIETFRVTDSFETAFEFIADLGHKGIISIVPTEQLTQILKEVYTHVRLWRIGGMKVIEMPEYRQPKGKVVSKKKKSKKKAKKKKK